MQNRLGKHIKTNNLKRLETPYMYTLGQAAKEAGVSKATISKAIKDGRLSVKEKTKAGFQIDPAELHRVYPKRSKANDSEQTQTHELNTENSILETKIEAKDEMISRLKSEIDDLKQQRDKWQEEASANRRLLENHSDNRANTSNRGVLGWFLGSPGKKD